jgi:hypothetical protein
MPKAVAVHSCQRLFLPPERREPACLRGKEIEGSPAYFRGDQASDAQPGQMELVVSLVLSNDARQPNPRGPIAPTKPSRCHVRRRQQLRELTGKKLHQRELHSNLLLPVQTSEQKREMKSFFQLVTDAGGNCERKWGRRMSDDG